MNLSGSLGAFGLADVFALLAMTGKTGALRVRRPSAEAPERCGIVQFNEGQIAAASSDEGRQALVRRLIGSGLVEDEALAAAVDRARSDSTGIARALRDAGAVDGDRLQQAARDQVVDGVFELLQWAEGDFEFALGEANTDDVDVHIPIEEVIGQARDRDGAWERALEVVPSVDSVLTASVRRDGDTVLAPDDWALLAMADGHRSVAELVELTGRGEFAVMITAAELVRRGLLVVRGAGDDDHVGVVQRRLALLSPMETSAVAPAAPRPVPQPVRARGGVPGGGGDGHLGVVVPDSPASLSGSVATASAARTAPSSSGGTPTGQAPTIGATAVAPQRLIERDPSVNRSLLLRVIAGVKGL